ncbi:hypothetical protein [Streptomyces sp. NPDC018833]|uniref:hypothetical protein n=1 Tax=Streptomyces sp. NPDC018833 TaxID=3365053 RepID=UPI00378AFAFA
MAYTPFYSGQDATADLLGTQLIEELMEWTSFANLGTFASGFTAGSNTPMLRKIQMLGQERWEYKGRISITAGTLVANTDTTVFTFDAGYRPTVEHGWAVCSASSDFFPIRMTLQTNGQIRAGVPTEAGNNANALLLDGVYIDEPI